MYEIENVHFNMVLLNNYLKLEDLDIFYLIKIWRESSDNVLRKLSNQLIDRKLPKIEVQEIPFSDKEVSLRKKEFYNKDDMENIQIVEATTETGFKKNSFIYDFMSSMRQKINDPLGKRAKKRKEISQR